MYGLFDTRIEKLEEKVENLSELKTDVAVLKTQQSNALEKLGNIEEQLGGIRSGLNRLRTEDIKQKLFLTWMKRIGLLVLMLLSGGGIKELLELLK